MPKEIKDETNTNEFKKLCANYVRRRIDPFRFREIN